MQLRIIAGVLGVLLCAASPGYLASVPLARDIPGWIPRHEAKVAESRARHPTLIWLGGSITQNFEKPDYAPVWNRFYGDRNAIDLGFSGDTTAHVLWRVENGELDGAQPKAIVVLVGANNLGLVHWNAAETVRGIDAIIAALRNRAPQAAILLIGTLPREGDAWVEDNQRAIVAALAKKYQGQPGITFFDPNPIFAPGGRIDDALYADPPRPALHPNPEGMTRIAAMIEPTLAKVLGDRVHGGS
jgi:lysophospholipase L1-like esterase